MLSFLLISKLPKNTHKLFAIPVALLFSLALTILINSSRIIISLLIQNQQIPFLDAHAATVHEVIGIVVNITFLILIYYLTEKKLNAKVHYEKLT